MLIVVGHRFGVACFATLLWIRLANTKSDIQKGAPAITKARSTWHAFAMKQWVARELLTISWENRKLLLAGKSEAHDNPEGRKYA